MMKRVRKKKRKNRWEERRRDGKRERQKEKKRQNEKERQREWWWRKRWRWWVEGREEKCQLAECIDKKEAKKAEAAQNEGGDNIVSQQSNLALMNRWSPIISL